MRTKAAKLEELARSIRRATDCLRKETVHA